MVLNVNKIEITKPLKTLPCKNIEATQHQNPAQNNLILIVEENVKIYDPFIKVREDGSSSTISIIKKVLSQVNEK